MVYSFADPPNDQGESGQAGLALAKELTLWDAYVISVEINL